MGTTYDSLRIPTEAGMPVRLARLLYGGPALVLDDESTALYSEVMNKIPGRSGKQGGAQPRGKSGSLYSFLEVAEQLYGRIADALATVGLSYAKYELLRFLHDSNGSVPLSVLAESQGCARSNITQLMDRLEADGLVRRVSDPDDRRSVHAEITPLGAAKAAEGAEQIDNVRAEFAASMTAAERQQLGHLLAKIG